MPGLRVVSASAAGAGAADVEAVPLEESELAHWQRRTDSERMGRRRVIFMSGMEQGEVKIWQRVARTASNVSFKQRSVQGVSTQVRKGFLGQDSPDGQDEQV
jgi:hypothetical protein